MIRPYSTEYNLYLSRRCADHNVMPTRATGRTTRAIISAVDWLIDPYQSSDGNAMLIRFDGNSTQDRIDRFRNNIHNVCDILGLTYETQFQRNAITFGPTNRVVYLLPSSANTNGIRIARLIDHE